MLDITIKVGDLLDETADVIVSTANPWLNMSGGVNGAILARGGAAVQEELRSYLRESGRSSVAPGTVVVTGPGSLRAKNILHAVAIDPFYDSSPALVRTTVERVLATAKDLGAKCIAMAALATGYGHLSTEQFAEGFSQAVKADWSPVERLAVVVRKPEYADVIRRFVNEQL